MRILVAEDDEMARSIMRDVLEGFGHSVDLAEDGRAAFEAMKNACYSVLISDWRMPGMDGIELCRQLRRLSDREYTYVIFITALSGRTNYLEAVEAGADDFITKPFDIDYLGSRLRVAERILGLKRHVRRLERLLPMCSQCRRIRDERRGWMTLESFLGDETRLSQTICPICRAEIESGSGSTGAIG